MASKRSNNDVWRKFGVSLALVTVLTETAEAHPILTTLSTNSFYQGLIHPLTGIDHWTSMIGLGILAGYLGGHAKWRLPIFFVSSMLVGALIGLLPISQSLATCTEFLIAASALCLGTVLLFAAKPSESAVLLMISSAGVWHGFAHAFEMPGVSAHAIDYFFGFALTTLFLLSAGVGSMVLPMMRIHKRAYVRYSGALLVIIATNLLFQQFVQYGS